MLQRLVIKNFALIDNLQVDFTTGLSTITGETGAGKSILLGGLALVLGKRADSSTLKNKDKKCIVEAEFAIDTYKLESFFEANDLDYESLTIIRREILPSGKSRAFINDTPIVLSVLNKLSERLIDIHSQHQTLHLADNKYQFQLIDSLANNQKYLASYSRGLIIYKTLQKELIEIQKNQEQAKQQYDYNLFLFEELEKANFQDNEQVILEQKIDKLSNTEQINEHLSTSISLIFEEQRGVLDSLSMVKDNLSSIKNFSKAYAELYVRIESAKIELDDIARELENQNDNIESSPLELEKYNSRLQVLYDLQKKHQVNTISELQKTHALLEEKVQHVDNASKIIQLKEEAILKVENQLNTLSKKIHEQRKKAIPKFVNQLEKILSNLEMPSVKFQLNLTKIDTFLSNGKDELQFLISTNKAANYVSISKGPSGGEMSRIMLAVKHILSKYVELPTIIFDEIDTGVSGEVSNKIADVMLQMSKNMQVISITHLPQIAAKGKQHYKVFKTESNNKIQTNIKRLLATERIAEIAEMLGGKKLTDSAIAHAQQLLK